MPTEPPPLVPVTGLEGYSTEILVQLRQNMLGGLDEVAAHVEAGTLFDPPKGTKGAVPPSEFGVIFLWFLKGATLELKRRGYQPPEPADIERKRRNGLA